MKSSFIILLFVFATYGAHAQVAQVVASGGGQQASSTISIDYTIGEAAVVSWTLPLLQVSEGLQASNYSTGLVTGLTKETVFSLYPNPAQRFLTIEGDFLNSRSLTITDLSGKQYRVPLEQLSYRTIVDVSELPAALYVLTIRDTAGETYRMKFIKVF